MLTLPNLLTIGRLLLLPFIMLSFMMEYETGPLATWLCFGLYAVAAITDFLDGWLARKLNQISAFGTFLDPISDKIFVGVMLVLLVDHGRLEGLWIAPVLVILAREFLVSGLREFLGPQNIKLPVTRLAKWKTATQMAALGLLILAPAVPYAHISGLALLITASMLTVMTGWGYMKAGLEVMRKMP